MLPADEERIVCSSPRIIDGDTFDCAGLRIRLAGIDTPEMPGHCRKGRACTPGDPAAARDELIRLTRSVVECRETNKDRYKRIVALCEVGGVDLSCAMIASGHAVARYAPIDCD
jgi:endonuclease YncB( thermonuclease family)